MLNVLIVGVPLMALLAAALYILRRPQPPFPGQQGSQQSSTFAFRPGQSETSTTVRRRSGENTRQSHAQDPRQAASLDSPHSGFADEEHCQICFEDAAKVQLYPCEHSDICLTCVNRLLASNRRECPFCRRRIDGYVDLENGQRFG